MLLLLILAASLSPRPYCHTKRVLSSAQSCLITKTKVLSSCSFDFEKYRKLIVLKENSEFQHINMWALHSEHTVGFQTSNIHLLAAGKIYAFHLSEEKLLTPVPFLLNCPEQEYPFHVSTCEFTFDADIPKKFNRNGNSSLLQNNISDHSISYEIGNKNFTGLGAAPALFLDKGLTIVSHCQVLDCESGTKFLTAVNDKFTFNITFEKPLDHNCKQASDCGPNEIYSCVDGKCNCKSQKRFTLTRQNRNNEEYCRYKSNKTLELFNPLSDPLIICDKQPDKCLIWCNMSYADDCICPIGSKKYFLTKTNNRHIFLCELFEGSYCDDEINMNECEPGTLCIDNMCIRLKSDNKTMISTLNRMNNLRLRSPMFAATNRFVASDNNDLSITAIKQHDRKSSILVKIYLCTISVVLLIVMCALTIAVAKLKSVRRKIKESGRPNVFLPNDMDTNHVSLNNGNISNIENGYGKLNFIHSGYIGPYDQFIKNKAHNAITTSQKSFADSEFGESIASSVPRSPEAYRKYSDSYRTWESGNGFEAQVEKSCANDNCGLGNSDTFWPNKTCVTLNSERSWTSKPFNETKQSIDKESPHHLYHVYKPSFFNNYQDNDKQSACDRLTNRPNEEYTSFKNNGKNLLHFQSHDTVSKTSIPSIQQLPNGDLIISA